MQSNNTLSLSRLGLLFRQGFIHNYKMIAISLVAFCGGLFLLLLTIQVVERGPYYTAESFSGIFLFIVIPMSIVYAGTAFPGLRTKEKSYSYLLTPASVLEKFIFELVNRVLLFVIIIPLLYWIVFHVEGSIARAISPQHFLFSPRDMSELFAMVDKPASLGWSCAFALGGMLIFTIPFAGAASFTKFPLPKTLFIVGLLFFVNFFLVYVFVQVMMLEDLTLPEDNQSILFMDGEADVSRALTGYGLVINTGLLVATYFKLREKEV